MTSSAYLPTEHCRDHQRHLPPAFTHSALFVCSVALEGLADVPDTPLDTPLEEGADPVDDVPAPVVEPSPPEVPESTPVADVPPLPVALPGAPALPEAPVPAAPTPPLPAAAPLPLPALLHCPRHRRCPRHPRHLPHPNRLQRRPRRRPHPHRHRRQTPERDQPLRSSLREVLLHVTAGGGMAQTAGRRLASATVFGSGPGRPLGSGRRDRSHTMSRG